MTRYQQLAVTGELENFRAWLQRSKAELSGQSKTSTQSVRRHSSASRCVVERHPRTRHVEAPTGSDPRCCIRLTLRCASPRECRPGNSQLCLDSVKRLHDRAQYPSRGCAQCLGTNVSPFCGWEHPPPDLRQRCLGSKD